MKPPVRGAVAQAFRDGFQSVAVLARGNAEASELRTYLTKKGLFPRQVGTRDFEDARHDVEQLPLLRSPRPIATQALDRLQTLVPTLPTALIRQVRARLGDHETDLARVGTRALPILKALEPIYDRGRSGYFQALASALTSCEDAGHHLPRTEAVWALRVAVTTTNDCDPFERILERYSQAVLTATHIAPRIERGLFVMTAHQAKGKSSTQS